MTEQFAVLPAPPGYQLVEINDNAYAEAEIDQWISEPQPVLGFLIRKQDAHFSVLPVTAFRVHEDGGSGAHALIRPDGVVDFCRWAVHIFESLDDLKAFILRESAETWRDLMQDEKDPKEVAKWRRHAKKLENEANAYNE